MFRKNVKTTTILLVALLVIATFAFSACSGSNKFTPVEIPTGTVEGNGGVAVKYGDWVYYVNGYQSSATADNGYTADIRTGSIVRIKIADLEKVISLNGADMNSTNKTKEIKKAVSGTITKTSKEQTNGCVETVVPNFYYTANTSSTALNGIYVFKFGGEDRLFITTPNNQLDANGDVLSSQLVLASYNMGGGDMKRHFVFESNAPQLKLSMVGETLYATYILNNKLMSLKVGENTAEEICEEISSPVFTGNFVYFLDKDGSIGRYTIGTGKDALEAEIVKNEVEEGHEGHSHNNSYSIVSANGEYVYYTCSKDVANVLHYAKSKTENGIVINTIPSGSYYGWQDKIVYTSSITEEGVTMYGIWITSKNGADEDTTEILYASKNDNQITFNKLEGNILYYTVKSISYTLDLSQLGNDPVPYAYSLGFSATGWSVPDVLSFTTGSGDSARQVSYVFTLGSGSVSVVKFNYDTLTNNLPKKSVSSSTTITLTEPVEIDDPVAAE